LSFERSQYDVVLLYPPAEEIVEQYDEPDFPNIGIAYVGSYLERHGGITPALIDARLSRLSLEETVRKVVGLKPRLLGIGGMTHMVVTAAELAARIKRALPGVKIVLGGFHASCMPERSLEEFPAFDFVAVGESEMAFLELTRRVLAGEPCHELPGIWSRQNGGVARTGRGPIPPTLDELGAPGWHLFDPADMEKHCTTTPVMGIRGCPFNCNFCSRPYGRKVRKRTPRLIVDEIERDVHRFGATKIHFFDETFSVDRKHTVEVCRGLIDRGLNRHIRWTSTVHANTVNHELAQLMKESGCVHVGLGAESGDEEILGAMGKGVTRERIIQARRILKRAGITTMGFFILGHPDETRASIWRSIRFAAKLNPDVAAFGILVPYPGTETWDLATRGQGGYKKLSADWRDYNKQLGNAVELEKIGRREIELYQILGYLLVYLLNLRFRDLFRVGRENSVLALSILAKIVFPNKRRRSAARRDRSEARDRRKSSKGLGSWGD
jgi:anaerobic magnesium-protoporphyrin IX monomethyl ester cyclase